MKLSIEIKGVVENTGKYEDMRRADRYKEGGGVYALEDGGVIVGYVEVYDLAEDGDRYNMCNTTYFNPVIASSVSEGRFVEEMKSHIQDCCDKVCMTIKHVVDEHDNHIATIIGQEHDEIKAEGNGITERTLLEALKIVSK